MKNKIALTILALGLTLPAVNVVAQDGPRPPRGPRGDGPRPPAPPIIAALDVNHDGVLDESELNGAPESLRSLDADKDGKLTLEELRPERGPRPGAGDAQSERPRRQRGEGGRPGPDGERPERPQGPPFFAALDSDGDGVVDATEISNATASLKKMDKNSDGQVSMDELNPRGGERGPRGGDDRRPPGNKRRPAPEDARQ